MDRRSVRVGMSIARLLLIGQLACTLAFSTVQFRRGSLTLDFAVWDQARWFIQHGHLNPYDTVQTLPFWQVNGNWLMWPLAWFSWIPPHGLWLLWLQDLAVFGCGWVVLRWIINTTSDRRAESLVFASLLLVLNPWTYRTAASDFHWETIAAFFAILTAWDLVRGRHRRMWIWALVTMTTAVPSALYIVGVGCGGVLLRRSGTRRAAVGLVVSGLGWIMLVLAIHADRGSFVADFYGYLAGSSSANPSSVAIVRGALAHPSRPLSELWSNRLGVWANVSPSGLVGALTPLGLGLSCAVLIPSLLWSGHLFAQPSFQNYPLAPFVVLGSVMMVAGRSGRPWLKVLRSAGCVVMVVIAMGWAWVWLPDYPARSLQVSAAGGATLRRVRSLIPSDARVIVNDGISGRFGQRKHVHVPGYRPPPVSNFPLTIRLDGKPVFFVLSLSEGDKYLLADTEATLLEAVQMGARVVMSSHGIWVLRWQPPPGLRTLVLHGASGGRPAWRLQSTVGRPRRTGPVGAWRMEGDGRPGYVVWGDYWAQPPGHYEARVRLASTGSVTIEAVDALSQRMLAAQTFASPTSTGQRDIAMPFAIDRVTAKTPSSLTGRGPFSYPTPTAGATRVVEIRVVNPSDSLVSVFSVGVHAVAV